MTVLQWRGPHVNLLSLTNPVLKALLTHPEVSADELETFKGEVRKKATPPKPLPAGLAAETGKPRRPTIYVQSDVVDDAPPSKLPNCSKNAAASSRSSAAKRRSDRKCPAAGTHPGMAV